MEEHTRSTQNIYTNDSTETKNSTTSNNLQGDLLIIADVAETFSHRTRESNFEIYR